MSDVTLFVFGAIVSLMAVSGAGLYVYGRHFRPAWERQQRPDSRIGTRRERVVARRAP